jgi:U1 small nuclear ribonucleoprotein
MTDKLPPNLLALFAPRPPLRYILPGDFAPEDRKTVKIDGVGSYLAALKEYKETDVYEQTESWLQHHDRVKQEKKAKLEYLMKEGVKDCEYYQESSTGMVVFIANWNGAGADICLSTLYEDDLETLRRQVYMLTFGTVDKPQEDSKIKGDAFKTLFVARLSYDVDERDLRREFGRFGAIEHVRTFLPFIYFFSLFSCLYLQRRRFASS